MEGMPEDMWSPYKHLYKIIERTIANPSGTTVAELDMCLKKYKQNFVTILRNPPRNERHRNQLLNGLSDGIQIPGHSRTILLSKDLVDECIILSDMYELDEFIALELLCTAQRQMSQHPGLPRGLVAILLYYDGRKALTNSLRDLFQVTIGVSWVTDIPKELTVLISAFTQSLVEDANILEKIIDLLDELDFTKESLALTRNRAVGPKKHQNQVTELFEDIRLSLATALFYWSAQRGLTKSVVVKLMCSLYKSKETDAHGLVEDTTLTMLMALLFAFDTSVLQRQEDHDMIVRDLPIMSETDFAQHIYESLYNMREITANDNSNVEEHNRFSCIVKFAFGLSLASLRHAPQNLQSAAAKVIERDEQLIDEAISEKIFAFLYHNILEKDIVFRTEFFYRRIHLLFTDFIEFMHSKVTELRGRADETARTVLSFAKEGLEPPANLDHNFELLMLSIGKFYEGNRTGLSLCVEYWGPVDVNSSQIKTTTRAVSLFKFIRLAGELLPTTLFVPYLKMVTGLTSCERSARNAFNLLKQSGLSGSATLSWEHFFSSLTRYYTNLRQEQHPSSDTIYRSRVINRSINPLEIEGLQAVLGIIRAVATYDEIARIALCEHPSWAPLQVLLGLLCCSVPLYLKASILQTLSALAKSKETAVPLWNTLEASQIIATVPSINSYTNCKIQIEIEQNECRLESYPLSQGILDLFYSLVTTLIPRNLGGGPRKPGFTPYLNFIINDIFLKCYNRNYKNVSEKWQVAQKCLRILSYLLKVYEVNPDDFNEFREEYPPAGFHINLQLHTKSDMLRLILLIIDETRKRLDEFSKFPGKEYMEQCALDCLNILEKGLEQQDLYFEAHSLASSSVLLSGLRKILLDVNPASRRPDHVLNTTKFITYWNWLPYHALSAIKILHMVSHQPNISTQLLDVITQTAQTHSEIRQGFVECLESELPTNAAVLEESMTESNQLNPIKIELQIKEAIIELLLDCLRQPAPNLTHFLLGFDPSRDINIAGLRQRPGVLETSNNCTRSIVLLLDSHLQSMKSSDFCVHIERIVERAYCLLYALCSHPRLSDTILRYFRSCNDFLSHHLSALPFRHVHRAHVLMIMSHLLKCAAIELKLSATNCQISRFQHMCNLMVGAVAKTPVNMSMDWNQYYATTHTAPTTFLTENANMTEQPSNLLLSQLLDCLEFECKHQSPPKWDFFDNALMGQIFAECEYKSEQGHKILNIKKMHEILNDELCTVQSSIASGQRKLILQEIVSVLEYAVQVNEERNKDFATVKMMEAWGQITEILFSCAPETSLSDEIKRELLFEILQKILNKILPVQPLTEISILCSGTLLLLLVNLRCCYAQKNFNSSLNDLKNSNFVPTLLEKQSEKLLLQSNKSDTLSLKFILKNILEWIIISSVGSQKLRINLYAALLNCLCIVRGNNTAVEAEEERNEFFISRLDKTVVSEHVNDIESSHLRMSMEVFLPFGEKLIDILCNDCITGHDICKMSALSCIDALLELDLMAGSISFIANRGYLTHITKSLIQADEDLCRILCEQPDNLRSLYVYESKMAMLLRLASSHVGAELILTDKVMGVLSSMKVFDMHPEYQGLHMHYGRRHKLHEEKQEGFVPSVYVRFGQILFPALNLCDALISTLGSDNHSVISQIVQFLISHSDMIEMVLRTATPFMELGLLRELTALTGLIARSTNQEIFVFNANNNNSNTTTNSEISVNLFRIQRLVLSILPRFIINDTTFKDMLKPENIAYEPTEHNKALHLKYFLEIAANLSLYCRNAVYNHSADHRANAIIFTASNPAEGSQRNDALNKTKSPSLDVIISQLKGTVEYYNAQKLVVDNILRQRSSISNINFDKSAKDVHLQLSQRYNEKLDELALCAFITEQCLYLLWTHLDFYMRRSVESNYSFAALDRSYQDTFNSSGATLNADISTLKKNLISIFNETFCKQLLLTSATQSVTDKGFNEALLRRIKSLIQFVPVN